MKKILVAVLGFSLVIHQLHAQVSFTASANKVVETGERFRLNFTVNADGSKFVPPDLSQFMVLGGPSSSTSTSFQFINGKTSQSISTTYSYILESKKEGKYTIGKAEITVDGKVYASAPITIEVVKGNTIPQDVIADQQAEKSSDDIFIQYLVDKTTVYQGEQVNVTLKIYDGIKPKSGAGGLNGFNRYKAPALTGFFSYMVKDPAQNTSLDRENYKNKVYFTGKVWQSLLFPQQSGTLTIEPFELECILQVKAGQRRTIFGGLVDVYDDITRNLRSAARTIKVLPLPENAPASFNGAVGSNFQISAVADKTELKTNESISLKISLSGNGNIKIIDKVNVSFPSSFEVYDPKVTNNISTTIAGSKGTNTYEYLIIPREAGQYTIPSIEFSYFDVVAKAYKTLKTQEFSFTIEKGEGSGNVTTSGVSKEFVKELGSDIRFIIQHDFDLHKKNKTFFGSLWFYLYYIISAIVFLIAIVVLRHRIKLNENIGLLKNKRANRLSKKRLKLAATYVKKGDKTAFYDEAIRALWGYLSDKLGIPVSNLSRETAREALEKKKLNPEIIDTFIKTIDDCEFAKYAPASAHNQIEQDYENVARIINKLENTL
jgi:hypothetical protein